MPFPGGGVQQPGERASGVGGVGQGVVVVGDGQPEVREDVGQPVAAGTELEVAGQREGVEHLDVGQRAAGALVFQVQYPDVERYVVGDQHDPRRTWR